MPREILLATDLSARCDRAFDRAVQLAKDWKAKLTIVHAIEASEEWEESADLPSWQRKDYLKAAAEQDLRDQLRELEAEAEILIERADPSEFVLRIAERRPCDLIVTGIASSKRFSRAFLGSTIERLIRSAQIPLFVVKKRPRHPYEKVVAATDFSENSKAAFQSAGAFFPEAEIVLFHAYATEAGGLSPQAEEDPARRLALEECAEFIARAMPSDPAKIKVVLEPGFPEPLLGSYLVERQIDLLAIGRHGRSGILGRLLGSTAEWVIASAPCDVLIAPGQDT